MNKYPTGQTVCPGNESVGPITGHKRKGVIGLGRGLYLEKTVIFTVRVWKITVFVCEREQLSTPVEARSPLHLHRGSRGGRQMSRTARQVSLPAEPQ